MATLTQLVAFRLTEEEAARLAEAATKARLTKSDVIRKAIKKLEVENEREKK